MPVLESVLTGSAVLPFAFAWAFALSPLGEPRALRDAADAGPVIRDLAWCVVSAVVSAVASAVTDDDGWTVLARITIALWPLAFVLRTHSIEPRRLRMWFGHGCAVLVTLWTGIPVAMAVAVPAVVGVGSRLTFVLALLEAGVLAAVGLALG